MAIMVMGVSGGVMAQVPSGAARNFEKSVTSRATVRDTLRVEPTCTLILDGTDTASLKGGWLTLKATLNKNHVRRKCSMQ